jgi:hypothetical protein
MDEHEHELEDDHVYPGARVLKRLSARRWLVAMGHNDVRVMRSVNVNEEAPLMARPKSSEVVPRGGGG